MSQKLLKYIYWTLFIGAVVLLYFSLRTQTLQLEYALAALALWGGAFFINRFLRKDEPNS